MMRRHVSTDGHGDGGTGGIICLDVGVDVGEELVQGVDFVGRERGPRDSVLRR